MFEFFFLDGTVTGATRKCRPSFFTFFQFQFKSQVVVIFISLFASDFFTCWDYELGSWTAGERGG